MTFRRPADRDGGGPSDEAVRPGPAPIVRSLLRRVDWVRLVAAKQANYVALAQRLRHLPGVDLPRPQLDPGSVPLGLPVLLSDADALAARLRRSGVEATRWPGSEQIPLEPGAFPGAERWLAHGVTLPVTAGLGRAHLDRIATAVARAVGAARPLAAPGRLSAAAAAVADPPAV